MAEEEGTDTADTPGPATSRVAYPEEPETADAPALTPTASATASAPASAPAAVNQGQSPAEPADILPLGSGLMLIGLGLALAFVGLRVRRS
ncbi:hypothetical protein GTW40_26415 [Streptomyces sp. SID4985]|nr:hypothetical protein [Streptomyces sp. SID4985]